jgi:hypothetical protein
MSLTRLNVNAAMLNASATKEEVNRVQSVSTIYLSLLILTIIVFFISCIFTAIRYYLTNVTFLI